jgi:hypothetical protein
VEERKKFQKGRGRFQDRWFSARYSEFAAEDQNKIEEQNKFQKRRTKLQGRWFATPPSEFAARCEGQNKVEEGNKFQKKKGTVQDQGSSRMAAHSFELAAEAEGQNKIEEPNKFQKRRVRHQDAWFSTQYSKLSAKTEGQNKVEELNKFQKRRDRVQEQGFFTKNIAQCPKSEGILARNVSSFAPQKKIESAPKMNSFSERTVVIIPSKKLSEEPLPEKKVVIYKKSPSALEFRDNNNSHSVSKIPEENKVVIQPPYSSDWSDAGESSIVTLFQDEPSSLSLSVLSEPSSFKNDYSTQQPNLYYSPWNDYTSCWTSNTKLSPCLSSSSSSSTPTTTFQARRDSWSFLNNYSYYTTSSEEGIPEFSFTSFPQKFSSCTGENVSRGAGAMCSGSTCIWLPASEPLAAKGRGGFH